MRLTVLAAGALLALSACGSGSSTTTAGQAGGAAAGGTGQTGGAGFGGRFPGASGQIAEVDGRTLQVQSQAAGQVAVTWSASTTITAEVKATFADVSVGTCVTVVPVRTAGGTTASAGTDAGAAAGSGPIAAGEVRITPAANGSCDAGFGRFGGGAPGGRPSGVPSGIPSGAPSAMPSGAPSAMPSGAPSGFRGRAGGFGEFGANGRVTAVTAHGFTVAARTFTPARASASPSTHAVQVTVSGTTTYTTTQKTAGSALKVGTCVTASGTTDDTGAVKASRIQVSDPVSGQCGFGGFGGSRG